MSCDTPKWGKQINPRPAGVPAPGRAGRWARGGRGWRWGALESQRCWHRRWGSPRPLGQRRCKFSLSPFSLPRSLELLFANSQNNKLLYGEPPKSPRANRKFSSPPPLSITKSSSPSRRRKLSLNIPIITGGKALDLAALSCSSNGYASMYSSMAPFSKTTLDINKLYVSSNYPNKIPDEGEAASEKQEESQPSKQSKWPRVGRGVGSSRGSGGGGRFWWVSAGGTGTCLWDWAHRARGLYGSPAPGWGR